jgi:tetratricopeptide (TPR) repeat protein
MKNIIFCLLLLISGISCKKFLDEKPDKKLVVPATLRDLQALLDYYNFMSQLDPAVDELSADNYYLLTSTWQATLKETERRAYVWGEDIFEPNGNDWSNLYRKVYYANKVLEVIESIERNAANEKEWDDVKGQALMIRAKAFLQAVIIWSPAYDASTAQTDMGIPIRLHTDFSEPATRPSVQETYGQLLSDFKEAIPLLPVTVAHPARASKPAAYGLLARAYLSMRNYQKAGDYADSALKLNSTLINYNSLNASASFPIPAFNAEILFWTTAFQIPFATTYAKVDSALYRSYAANDCRKTVLFSTNTDGSNAFKGTYIGTNGTLFPGIATDEIYLMRAEAFARAGNTTAALKDLNTLLQMRMKTGTFIPATAPDAATALALIITERRKELLFRGLRWMDIKRLNKEGANIILTRVVNNTTYKLMPNEKRYALPIPEYTISISGMPQNPR